MDMVQIVGIGQAAATGKKASIAPRLKRSAVSRTVVGVDDPTVRFSTTASDDKGAEICASLPQSGKDPIITLSLLQEGVHFYGCPK